MYILKYSYTTGDSFGSRTYDDEEFEFEFTTKELARAAMQRIEEHYKWYDYCHYFGHNDRPPEPEWHKGMEHDGCIKLIVDEDGTEVQTWPPWIGYFESLHSIEVYERGNKIEF